MKRHFTVSPKISRRRVTASTDTEDEILITEDFCSNLYDALMEHCNCAGSDADVTTNNLYHEYHDKYVDRADVVHDSVMSVYNAAIGDGISPDELEGWMDELWDTVPDAVDEARKKTKFPKRKREPQYDYMGCCNYIESLIPKYGDVILREYGDNWGATYVGNRFTIYPGKFEYATSYGARLDIEIPPDRPYKPTKQDTQRIIETIEKVNQNILNGDK